MSDDDNPKTTTILTVDLPPDLGQRLRQAMRKRGQGSLHQITLQALEDWLERFEAGEA